MNIQLEIKQDPEIVAIPGEVRQLLANILNNAIDAVNYGGVIRIHVSAAHRRRTLTDLQCRGRTANG